MLTSESVEIHLHRRAYATLLSDFDSCHAVEGMCQVEVCVAQFACVDGNSVVCRLVDAVNIFATYYDFIQMLRSLQSC